MLGMPVADQSVRGGEDIAADTQRTSDGGTGTRINSATTTVIFMGRGVLKRLYIPTALAGILTIYDNISAAAPIVVTIPVGAVGWINLGVDMATGCTIVTAGADQVLVIHGK